MKHPDSQLEQKLMKLITFLFFLFVFLTFTGPIIDPDTPWHLKTGEYIFLNKTIPTSDPFSFAVDALPFIGKFILAQYWVAQVVLFLVYKYGGVFGLVLFRAAILTSLAALLRYLIRDKGFYLSFLLTGAFVYFLQDFQGIRPQLFTFLFSGIVICLFEKYKEKRNLSFLFPLLLLMPLWANLHGGFIYGIALIAIYMISYGVQFYLGRTEGSSDPTSKKQFYHLILICAFAVLFSMANPNIYKVFSVALTPHFKDIYSTIQEYKSPFQIMKSEPSRIVYGFLIYIFASAIMILIFIKRRDFTALLLLLFSIVPALVSMRYIPLFFIVATAMFRHIPVSAKPRMALNIRSGLHIVLIMASLPLMLYYNPLMNKNIFKFNDSDFYAVSASDFLIKNGISGNIFASYNKAAFLLFRLFPESRLYSDSRCLSETRIRISNDIDGVGEPVTETLEAINRLLPENIGTIKVTEALPSPTDAGDGNASRSRDNLVKSLTWNEALDNIKADIIVHEAVNKYSGGIYPLIFKLIRDDSWRLIYADGNVMIFLRDIKKYSKIIIKHNKHKSLIYDEIIMESLKNKESQRFYSTVSLALLLKGFADKKTNTIIDMALARNPKDDLAHYCKTIYILMDHARKQGAHINRKTFDSSI